MPRTTYDQDPFATNEKLPSISFKDKPIGTSYRGRVTERPNLVQSRDFETGEPATWDDGNPKMAAVVTMEVNGEAVNLWASKPSSMFNAIATAQREAGSSIEPGGELEITFSATQPNQKNPRLNDQKLYTARYTPPRQDAFAGPSAQQQSAAPPF